MKRLDNKIEEKSRWILTAVIVLGASLRLYHINFQSLWVDELFSIIPTNPDLSLSYLIENCKSDQPPFFFLYLRFVFAIFGYNEQVGRLASAAIGLIGILIVYHLGKEFGDKKTGLFAALLTSVNYFHIYYSQELRFYSMVFLLSSLSYLYFVKAYKYTRPIDFASYILATIALLYTHYFGMIILLTQGITFLYLLKYKRDKRFILSAIVSALLILGAFSFWLPVVFGGLSEVLPHIKTPSPFFFANYFYYYTGKDALSATLFCFFLFLFAKNLVKSQIDPDVIPVSVIIIVWVVLSYLIPYVRSVTVTPMLADRYTIITLPALIIAFSLGWSRINNLKLKYVLVGVLTASAILNLFFFKKHYSVLRKDQWREASNYVLSRNKNHYPVYSTVSWHFGYYFQKQNEKISDLYSSNLSEIDKFWFVTAHPDDQYMDEQIKGLQQTFSIVEIGPFLGTRAVLFERKR